ELSPEELKNLLQREGGSGIAKIKCILKHDLQSDGVINLEYISNNEFLATIRLNKNSGVTLNENINR
ncbi:hypothetical protein MJH12_02265, partial [bacterium]|nr:hypothetical protein [bacterium]